ncbi:hypothetical protein D1793_19005 [Halomonas sp. JS92-SW72]|nr:hypothetical protein D1793_19005 [Halomonas sp. JS92-SW72]
MPTSLIYIVLSTRGCSPWRPDAVMGTTWQDRKCSPRFSRTVVGAPDTAKSAVLYQLLSPISE